MQLLEFEAVIATVSASDGVSSWTRQAVRPSYESALTWKWGALNNTVRESVKLLPPLVRSISVGQFCLYPDTLLSRATSHHVMIPACGPPVSALPPRPSIVPGP